MSLMALRGQRPRDERIPPTAQTAARVRPDVIDAWVKAGLMREECLAAALEIRRVRAALSRGLATQARDFEAQRMGQASPQHGAYRDPIERMSLAEARIYTERYRPWTDELMHQRSGRPAVGTLELVRRIADENQTPEEAAFMHNLGPVAVLLLVGRALWRYGEIAGFARAGLDPFRPHARSSRIRAT